MNRQRGPRRRFQTPFKYDRFEWKKWPEASVKLRNVPEGVTTQDLHTNFSQYGTIVYIEVYQNRPGAHSGEARLRFEPAPSEDFWHTGHQLLIWGDGETPRSTEVPIELDRPSAFDATISSKVNPGVFYPAKVTLKVDTLDFGPGYTGLDLMVKKSLVSDLEGDDPLQLKLMADFKRRQLYVFFAIPVKDSTPNDATETSDDPKRREFKIQIEFRQLKKLFLQSKESGASNNPKALLTIPLDHPAAYYQRDESTMKHSFSAERLYWTDSDQWARTTHIFDKSDITQDFSVGLLADWQDPSFIDIGRWTTLRLHIQEDKSVLEKFLRALHDHNIDTQEDAEPGELDDLVCPLPSETRAVRNIRLYSQRVDAAQDAHGLSLLEESHAATVSPLKFPVQYQLEVCLSRGVLSEFLLSKEFLNRLRDLGPVKAQNLLECLADRGKHVRDPMSVLENTEIMDYYPQLLVPSYCSVIRKVLVTPTTLYYNAPSVEASNRILRQYSHLNDRFLRVQFVDELYLGRMRSLDSIEQDQYLFRRVFHTLINGIRIGDRHFKFLAFGNSQIRECGAYFFSEVGDVTCKSIRAWMGDFDHIRVVAKCAARIGQCFSTTRQIQGFRTPQITRIDDIERHGFCFTDGVGKISSFLAQVIVQEMGIDTKDTPSAFQFRMGGCKGVLAVWPDVKMTEVQIRKSQEKFTAQFNGLEIIRVAQFSVASLNRQTVTILSTLGVPKQAFLNLAESQIANYKKAMVDQTAAATLLGIYIDENQTSLTLRDLINWGFMDPDIQEPFVMTILQLWRTWSMKLLKEKARVVVDKGAFVLGCVDETGTLRGHSCKTEKENGPKRRDELPQIFLQIPDASSSTGYTPVKGVCLVGRNPSLHPGDIRIVEAVDCMPLRHLQNVVVFPSIGDRDVPGMLSGGDLDGDDFFVLWEPSLIPPEWNYPPMDYRAPAPEALDRDVHHHDLAQFFVKYMRNDCLPAIALSHLANADDNAQGAKSKICLQLAALHSKAVDFVKTGDPAILTKELRARRWPHFMERTRNTYHSGSALGLIYDKVGNVTFQPQYDNVFDQRILGKFQLDDDMLRSVRKIKSQYDIAMRRLMAQREIQSEFEVWTGFVLTRPRVGSGYKLTEDIGRESSIIKQQYRDKIRKAAGGSHIDNLAPWVAAMYKVTEEEMKIAQHRRARVKKYTKNYAQQGSTGMPLISFPWIFHAQLGYIATGRWAKNIYVDTDTAADKLPVRDWDGDGSSTGTGRPPYKQRETEYLKGINAGKDLSEELFPGGSEPVDPVLQEQTQGPITVQQETAPHGLGLLKDVDVVHLPDGRILHRGEVLHLFDDDSDEEWFAATTEPETGAGLPPAVDPEVSETPSSASSSAVASPNPREPVLGPESRPQPLDEGYEGPPTKELRQATTVFKTHMAEIEATKNINSEHAGSGKSKSNDPFAAIFHLARDKAIVRRNIPVDQTKTGKGCVANTSGGGGISDGLENGNTARQVFKHDQARADSISAIGGISLSLSCNTSQPAARAVQLTHTGHSTTADPRADSIETGGTHEELMEGKEQEEAEEELEEGEDLYSRFDQIMH